MRNLDEMLKYKIINAEKLIKYGFVKKNNEYIYKEKIVNNQFEMIVILSKNKSTSKLIDIMSEEEYILVDIEYSVGEFVGKVREEYEGKLYDIIEKCTDVCIFKQKQTEDVIKYVKKKYNDDLEYLWKKFPNNAICRNRKNNKWYALILTVNGKKLGLDIDKEIEIIDLRYQKEEINNLVDNKLFFYGYHMNKASWITIKLDGSVNNKKIFELIDNSYLISVGGKLSSTVDELSKKVYEYLLKIPNGKVVTYGQVAEYLGNKGFARIVGSILHKNPDGDKYPCYKVLNSKGMLAEAFVFGGKDVQKERLEKDGIEVIDYKVDLNKYKWGGYYGRSK